MTTEIKEKKFDCMKWLRQTRDRIYAETKDMTHEEERQRLDRIVAGNQFYASIPKAKAPPRLAQRPTNGAT